MRTITDVDKKRSELQIYYGDLWEKKGSWGALDLSPRFGKSKMALDRTKENEKVTIIYPLTQNRETWKKEADKWKAEAIDIKYLTFNSALRHLGSCDFLIIDEFHMLSKALLKKIRKLKFKRVLAISGSVSEQTAKDIYFWLRIPIVGVYPLEQAIKDGLVADYRIECVPVSLDNKKKNVEIKWKKGSFYKTEREAYDYYEARFNENKTAEDKLKAEIKELKEKYNLMMVDIGILSNTPGTENAVDELVAESNKLNFDIQTKVEAMENFNFIKMIYASKRMNLIYNSESKVDKTKELIEERKNDRCIIFTKRADVADSLTDKTYHSKNRDKEAFNDFIEGNIDHMGVIDMVSVGTEIPRVHYSIIQAYDSNPENLIQKINRTTTFEYDNPEKIAYVKIVYLQGTKDEEWLRSALAKFDRSKITGINWPDESNSSIEIEEGREGSFEDQSSNV